MARRAALTPLAGSALGPEPTTFLLFDANKDWYLATDLKRDVPPLYSKYAAIAARDTRDPEPLIMMAMLAGVSREFTSATVNLAGALDRSAARDGKSSAEFARIQLAQAALLAKQMRDPAGARQAWQEARAVLREDWQRQAAVLAEAHINLGLHEEALAYATASLGVARKLHPQAPEKFSWVAEMRATCLAELGRTDEASAELRGELADIEKAGAQDSPSAVAYLTGLARIELKRGRPAEAVAFAVQARARMARIPKETVEGEIAAERLEWEARIANGEEAGVEDALRGLRGRAAKELDPRADVRLEVEATALQWYRRQGREEEARELGAALLKECTAALGEGHAITRKVAQVLSDGDATH